MATVTEGKTNGYTVEEWRNMTQSQQVEVRNDYVSSTGYGVAQPAKNILLQLLDIKFNELPPLTMSTHAHHTNNNNKNNNNTKHITSPQKQNLNKIKNNNTHVNTMQIDTQHVTQPPTHVNTTQTHSNSYSNSSINNKISIPSITTATNNTTYQNPKKTNNTTPTPHNTDQKQQLYIQDFGLSEYLTDVLGKFNKDKEETAEAGPVYIDYGPKNVNYPTPETSVESTPDQNGQSLLGSVTPIADDHEDEYLDPFGKVINEMREKGELLSEGDELDTDQDTVPGLKRRKLNNGGDVITRQLARSVKIRKVPGGSGEDKNAGNRNKEKEESANHNESENHNTRDDDDQGGNENDNNNNNNNYNNNQGGDPGDGDDDPGDGDGDQGDDDGDDDKNNKKDKKDDQKEDQNEEEEDQNDQDDDIDVRNDGQQNVSGVRRQPHDSDPDDDDEIDDYDNNDFSDKDIYHSILRKPLPDFNDQLATELFTKRLINSLAITCENLNDVIIELDEAKVIIKQKNKLILDHIKSSNEQVNIIVDSFTKGMKEVVSTIASVKGKDVPEQSKEDRMEYEITKRQMQKIMDMNINDFEATKEFKGNTPREVGEFIYNIILQSKKIGDVSKDEPFQLWKKMVTSKFILNAKVKYTKADDTKLQNFQAFFNWILDQFNADECYAEWHDLILSWVPHQHVKWKDLLIEFKKYVQQYALFYPFAKEADKKNQFIDGFKFGNIIYQAVMNSSMPEVKKKELKEFVIEKQLKIELYDIKKFEEEILSVLIAREDTARQIARANPRFKTKSKRKDQMKLGREINAAQQNLRNDNYGRSKNYNPKGKGLNKRLGDYKRNRFGRRTTRRGRDFTTKHYDNDKRNRGKGKGKNNDNKWSPTRLCKNPSYERFRAGQTPVKKIQKWINNWDLQALVYVGKCNKCNQFGHYSSYCNLIKNNKQLRGDLRELSWKLFKIDRNKKSKSGKYGKGKRHANSIQITETPKNDTKSTTKNTNKNAQPNQQSQTRQVNLALSQTNAESRNTRAQSQPAVNMILQDTNKDNQNNNGTNNTNNSSNNNNNNNKSQPRYHTLSSIFKSDISNGLRYGVRGRHNA